MILALYGIIHAWYFYCGNPARDVSTARAIAPWYTRKREPSFLDILAALRRHLTEPAELAAHPDEERLMHEFARPAQRAA